MLVTKELMFTICNISNRQTSIYRYILNTLYTNRSRKSIVAHKSEKYYLVVSFFKDNICSLKLILMEDLFQLVVSKIANYRKQHKFFRASGGVVMIDVFVTDKL